MNDRVGQAERLGQRLVAGWRPEDVEAQLASLHARQRRTRTQRRVLVPIIAGAVAAAIAVMVWSFRADEPVRQDVAVTPVPDTRPPRAPVPPVVVAPAHEPPVASGALLLGDGSVVMPVGASRLTARQVSETDVSVALAGSGARFEVPDRTTRRFRADVGALALETHGAVFRVDVTRRRVEVTAERGQVSAQWGHERRVVAAGQTQAFVTHDDAVVRNEPDPPSTWRDDAGRGDYATAWAALAQLSAPLDAMEDLLLAGDVARLSGHPEAAVAPLGRAVSLHPNDPRAQLAAFSLGRVHLENLGAPRDAALAFAHARELAPDGPLAEDALAREVEAWSRAGETETARQRALSYVQRYPDGHRARAVRRFGGLEGP